MVQYKNPMLTQLDILYRLTTILALSGLIGLEREYHGKPAGLRTNIMVGLGSTLMTMAGVQAANLVPGVTADPTRIAAQVITGIGFIGAGAILRPTDGRNNGNVVGLTTAATLWVVSGLGIAVGMGLYYESVVTTLMVFFTFSVLGRLVVYVRKHSKVYTGDLKAHEEADEKPRHEEADAASVLDRLLSYVRKHAKNHDGERTQDHDEDPPMQEA